MFAATSTMASGGAERVQEGPLQSPPRGRACAGQGAWWPMRIAALTPPREVCGTASAWLTGNSHAGNARERERTGTRNFWHPPGSWLWSRKHRGP